MGYFLFATTAPLTWTLLLYLFIIIRIQETIGAEEQTLLQDLGVDSVLDVRKINISQDEYTSMMSAYLTTRQQHSADVNSIPELITFYMVKQEWTDERSTRLKFPIQRSVDKLEVDNAVLRILAPAQIARQNTIMSIRINQILGVRRKRLIEEKTLYLSSNQTKWCEFDVTAAVQSWFEGERNLGLEMVSTEDLAKAPRPLEAAISALVFAERRRWRRSPYQPARRTDCPNSRTRGKRKCCRHEMTVKFADLRFPEMNSIVQPKFYEAGFCQGQCPPNYNHATNHSRIQSLVHQLERKGAKKPDRRAVPKACCAPSKLDPLEILRVNPNDATKLIVEKWDNMQVVECACS